VLSYNVNVYADYEYDSYSKYDYSNIQNVDCDNKNLNINGININQIPSNSIETNQISKDNGEEKIDVIESDNSLLDDKSILAICTNVNDNKVISITKETIPPDPEPEPEPDTGIQLEITNVSCSTNNVSVQTTLSNIEHGSEDLVYLIAWTAEDGNLIYSNDLNFRASDPNPATKFTTLNQNVEPGEYFIHVIVGGDVASEAFTAPSCPDV